jgi:hypothetical protein
MRRIDVDRAPTTALNRICAYFTMFPLRFPFRILSRAEDGQRVLDPFCGRGTTNYAARLLGLDNFGVDSSRVAAAIAAAKVVAVRPSDVEDAYREVLEAVSEAEVPEEEFWRWAYASRTLKIICRLRAGLLADCKSPERIALRALLLGALHGPLTHAPSYLSNQAPRTFAPKPAYSVMFWKKRGLHPPEQDVAEVISRRSRRYFGNEQSLAVGRVIVGDSRTTAFARTGEFDWVITSPPYYGMRTYVPDQWIRNWFVGGPPTTDYSAECQLTHLSPDLFAADLRAVWLRAARAAVTGARLVVRFGGINDRKVDPLDVLKASLVGSGWQTITIRSAGSAAVGRRQALAFAAVQVAARDEYDLWAVRA